MRTELLLAFAVLAGCGSAPKPPAAAPAKTVEYFKVDPSSAGTVTGKVWYKGPKPRRERIAMSSDAECAKAHAGAPAYDDTIVLGSGGALANAFVYIKEGLEGKRFPAVEEAVVLDQHGCTFVPRVIGLRARQMLSVKNSDPVSHSVHPIPVNNREWNEQQGPQSADVHHSFPRPEIMIPVKCNVHQWMRAYIGVMDHPYFAVTGPEGSFEFKNVPAGGYTVAVWHEKLGSQTAQAAVAAAQTAAVNFTYR